MPYGINADGKQYAECPRCKKVANGRTEIEYQFGYRTMEQGNVIPQLHCRQCRSEEANANR